MLRALLHPPPSKLPPTPPFRFCSLGREKNRGGDLAGHSLAAAGAFSAPRRPRIPARIRAAEKCAELLFCTLIPSAIRPPPAPSAGRRRQQQPPHSRPSGAPLSAGRRPPRPRRPFGGALHPALPRLAAAWSGGDGRAATFPAGCARFRRSGAFALAARRGNAGQVARARRRGQVGGCRVRRSRAGPARCIRRHRRRKAGECPGRAGSVANPSNAGGFWGVECARRVRAGDYPPRTFPARPGAIFARFAGSGFAAARVRPARVAESGVGAGREFPECPGKGQGENNRAQRNRESVFPSARRHSAGSGECGALAASAGGDGRRRVRGGE